MKRILITGKNSYIGNSFEEWVSQRPQKYNVDKISVRNDSWINMDWTKYDVLIHVAGIVHSSIDSGNENKYFDVNRDLAYNIAKKAKVAGIKQFIFMSTMSVYGVRQGKITKETKLAPRDVYGKSKLEAEHLIFNLESENFKVSIIRPPMVYGKNAPGNYKKLSKIAKYSPIFPKISNKRSMIYIDNLSNFIVKIIESNSRGIFCPQNKEYVNVQKMVEKISSIHGRKVFFTAFFNPILRALNSTTVDKVFGNLFYDKTLSYFDLDYIVYQFDCTLENSEFGKDL